MIRPFGSKAARFIRRSPVRDAKINILEGAVRSSKTYAINAKLVSMLSGAYSDWSWPAGGIGLISAVSKTTARTNMLSDVFSIVGEKRYKYNQQSGELTLCGKPFLVCGAKDEGSFKFIRGATVGIWIADELTIYPRSFFDMALSRLSLPGSRMYGSTNPGNPYHYLKADYLDRAELRETGELWSEHFTLDDNPNIDDATKESFRRMYRGVFHRWYILGDWCIADGSIYRDVLSEDIYYDDSTRPQGLLSQNGHTDRFLAIDVGTLNAFVALDFYDDGRTLWVDNETYWSGRDQNRQLTNAEYADRVMQLIGQVDPRRYPTVIVDPSAASFKVELLQRGVLTMDGENEVLEGIRKVTSMLGQKKLRIHKRCTNLRRELETYAWDDKRSERGVEQPVKAHDDSCDALRYGVHTKINDWRIAA